MPATCKSILRVTLQTSTWACWVGILALLDAHPVDAWCQMTTAGAITSNVIPEECNHQGIPLSWDRRCMEVAIEIGGLEALPNENVKLSENEVREIVDSAFTAWEAVSAGAGIEVVLNQQNTSCDLSEFNSSGGNMNSIILANDWPERGYQINSTFIPYDPSAFAVTTAWHNAETGSILDVDIEINERRGPYVDCPNSCTEGGCVGQRDETGRQVVDLLNVVTHEVGHFWGLDHPVLDDSDSDDESLSTMWAKSPAGEVCKRTLKEDDIDGLRAIYPAESLTGVCDFAPFGGRSFQCGGESGGCACSVNRPLSPSFFAFVGLAFFLVWRTKTYQKQLQRHPLRQSR